MFFSQQALNEMNGAQKAIGGKYESLLMKYVTLPLNDATAKEYATQGFPRRLGVMVHCIHNVFTTLPPEKEEIPSKTQIPAVRRIANGRVVSVLHRPSASHQHDDLLFQHLRR